MKARAPRFTLEDCNRAADEWGANCGPGALAAICGLTLDEVRRHMGDFERKGYTNPTLMWESLNSIVAAGHITAWRKIGKNWPDCGLVRIQWEGPWMRAGVPARAAYPHTHWVGATRHGSQIGVFDINMINNGTGWASREHWRTILVPWLLKECVPRADGNWHITHGIEIARCPDDRTPAGTSAVSPEPNLNPARVQQLTE